MVCGKNWNYFLCGYDLVSWVPRVSRIGSGSVQDLSRDAKSKFRRFPQKKLRDRKKIKPVKKEKVVL